MASYDYLRGGIAPGQTRTSTAAAPPVVPALPAVPGTTTGTAGGTYYGQLPPYLMDQAGTNLASELKGQVPQDVQDQINQSAAQWGVASGMPGSQLAQYKGLRDLGLTSLDLSQKATQSLLPFYTSPLQSSELALKQQQANLQNQMLAQQLQDQRMSSAQAYQNQHPSISGPITPPIVQPHEMAAPRGYTTTGGLQTQDQHVDDMMGDFLNRYLPGAVKSGSPLQPWSGGGGVPNVVGGGMTYMGPASGYDPEAQNTAGYVFDPIVNDYVAPDEYSGGEYSGGGFDAGGYD